MSKVNNYFRCGHETFLFDETDLESVTRSFSAACLEHDSYVVDRDSPRPRISVFKKLSGHLARIHQIGVFE